VPFEEKITWVNAVVAVIVPVVYFAIMMGRLGNESAADISYQWPLLIAIGASVILTIIGSILAGIGTGISAELRGRSASDDIDRKDERDKQISRHGDLIGFYVSSVGMVGVLALTMLEYEYFWIASALYLSFVVGTLVGSVVKIASYHRGF
jgi:NADH:ubiquinone oxidoreductase subunit 6 (subunit J)